MSTLHDPKTSQDIIVSVEGYKAMNTGKEYILFLSNTDIKNTYTIVAVNQGKYAADNSVEIYEGKEAKEYKRIEKFTYEVNGKYK